MSISSAGSSALQMTKQINAFQNNLQTLKSTTNLDSKLISVIESALKDLNVFSNIKSPTVKDYGEITRKIAEFFDHMAEVDESFVRDFLEEHQIDKKRAKGKVISEYLLEQSARINPATIAMATSQAIGTVEKSNSSSSLSLSLSNQQEPDWGDPLFTQEDAEAAGINMGKVSKGELAETAALADTMKNRPAAGKVSHYSASTAAASSLLQMAKGFSPEELKEMIKGILKRGIKDLGDVADLMKLVGELGLETPKALMDDIIDALTDFLADAAQNATSLMDFLAFVKTFQALTSDIGGNLFSNDLADSLSDILPTEDNKSAAEEFKGLGIKVELIQGLENGAPGDLEAVDKAMAGQKAIEFISSENSLLAEAAAGAQGSMENSKKIESRIIALNDIAIQGVDNAPAIPAIDTKEDAGLLDSGQAKPEDFKKLATLLFSLMDSKKSEFMTTVLETANSLILNQIA